MDEFNCPYCVFIGTNPGTVMPFHSILYDQFAAHGSNVGIGPITLLGTIMTLFFIFVQLLPIMVDVRFSSNIVHFCEA
jgi:hypothetical protein